MSKAEKALGYFQNTQQQRAPALWPPVGNTTVSNDNERISIAAIQLPGFVEQRD